MLSSVFIFLPVYKLCYCPHLQSVSEKCGKTIPNPKEGEGAGKSPLRLSHMAKSYQTLLWYWSCTEFQPSETDFKNIMWDPPIIILQLFFVVSYYENRLVLIVNKRTYMCTITVSLSSIAPLVKPLNSQVCNLVSVPTIPYLPKPHVSHTHACS